MQLARCVDLPQYSIANRRHHCLQLATCLQRQSVQTQSKLDQFFVGGGNRRPPDLQKVTRVVSAQNPAAAQPRERRPVRAGGTKYSRDDEVSGP